MASEKRPPQEGDAQEPAPMAETETESDPGEREAGRLKPSYADTPEFAAAVNEAVAAQLREAVPAILAQLAALQGGAAPTGSDEKWARGLALAIAEVSGQGTGKIYVDPAVLETRKNAHERMTKIIVDLYAEAKKWADIHGDSGDNPYVPLYKLVAKTQLPMGDLGETLVDPLYRDNDKIVRPVEIDWSGVPNLAMQPLNDAAKEVFGAFCESIGHRAVPEPDALMAVTSHGAVVRGTAASVILRNDRGERELGQPGETGGNPDGPKVTIRRRDTAPKQLVNVLGTIHKPVEVS